MKLTVLGSRGPYPFPGDACSGYLLEEGKVKLVLDLGAGTLANLRSVCEISDLTAVIVSHLHWDHISDLFVLQYALQRSGRRLAVYAPADPENIFNLLCECKNFDVTPITETLKLDFDGITACFAKMSHSVTDYAVKLNDGSLDYMYTGDTAKCETLEQFAKGVHTMICDCSFFDDVHSDKHLSMFEACEVGNAAGVRHLIMAHFDPDIRPQKYFQRANTIFKGRVSKGETLAIINL